MTRRKRLLFLVAFFAVASLILNLYCLQYIAKLKDHNSVYADCANNTIVLRLDRQSDICFNYGIYFEEMADGRMTKEEFLQYALGTELLTREDMLRGFYSLQFGDDNEIAEAFHAMPYSTYVRQEDLDHLSAEDMDQLSELYSQLSELFNRNNKQSLSYFVSVVDMSNPDAVSAGNEICAITDQIVNLLGNS